MFCYIIHPLLHITLKSFQVIFAFPSTSASKVFWVVPSIRIKFCCVSKLQYRTWLPEQANEIGNYNKQF